MPLHKVVYLSNNTKLYLWKITEDFDTLFSQVKLKDSSLARLETMKSESHKKGFLAVRMLLQHNDYSDFDLFYDEFGKPHLKPQGCSIKDVEISISHSNDFSAIAISDSKVGLDLEQLKEKALRIATRFMDVSHLDNLSEEEKIKKATVVWGIKESIFKIKNEKGISFPNHIFEDDFSFEDKKATATLKFNNKEETFQIQFDSVEDYIFVCAFESINN
ncbi:4'-phosphopantetheinyl transferase superfamily protein [Flavobacterium sp.]|uniref:4'-phosphopantetheinyl transferase family protein n=1 Tax=Flavobacterium sp. TaxID=239 RepID=UPI00260FDD6A|nr:4'-phosphopantetheinyl transferase superfamily protein [Flavobacterium sp.]